MSPSGDAPAEASAPAAAPGPPLVASVIDVGSNSVLLLTVEVGAGGRARVVDTALVTTRLGDGLAPAGRLAPAACARTAAAVAALAGRARNAGAARLWAFGTAALRRAADGATFARELGAAGGFPVQILSGEEEARLAYAAAAGVAGTGGRALLVVDVGGGTTELALGCGAAVAAAASLPLGALALGQEHLRSDPPPATEAAALAATVNAALAGTPLLARVRQAGATLAASGGTATALAALDLALPAYDGARVHGHVLSRVALAALVRRALVTPAAARAAWPSLDPGRAAILPAGAVVLERVADAAGADGVVVSDHGVRHAYLRARLAEVGVSAAFAGAGR